MPLAVYTPTLKIIYPASAADNYTGTPVAEPNANGVSLQSFGNATLTTLAYTFTQSSANISNGMEVQIGFGNNFGNAAYSVVCTDWDIRETPSLPTNQQTSAVNVPLPELRSVALDMTHNLRYFKLVGGPNNQSCYLGTGHNYTGGAGYINLFFPVPMRAAPTMAINTQTAPILCVMYNGGSINNVGAVSFNQTTTFSSQLSMSYSTPGTGQPQECSLNDSYFITASAEIAP